MKAIIHEPAIFYEANPEVVFAGIPKMDSDAFFEFCCENPDIIAELDEHGRVHLMSPVNIKSGNQEVRILALLFQWNEEHVLGTVFSSSTGFTLPNGSVRSPDAAWISAERLQELPESEKDKFAKIVPDFVLELRSRTDRISNLRKKMEQYIQNGVRLGFLIDPYAQTAWIYRANGSEEEVADFSGALSGEDVLPGFSLSLKPFSH